MQKFISNSLSTNYCKGTIGRVIFSIWKSVLISIPVGYLVKNAQKPMHKHSPEGATAVCSNSSHLITAYYSFIDPEDERLSWPS